ncbi:hypothetical protein MUO32_25300 [Shinella sp. CPCC 101442]|uniref:hypothetical protein n=1 Tax=Shinella sp. CPCC 101442 TaxID=2932265 RepID=UPI002152DAE8|nr:hypothetical protein [Shinella sp. CPCC 101442]MCR6502350.1 hypothetical protein [Shinella sp. CPCC 101442]
MTEPAGLGVSTMPQLGSSVETVSTSDTANGAIAPKKCPGALFCDHGSLFKRTD